MSTPILILIILFVLILMGVKIAVSLGMTTIIYFLMQGEFFILPMIIQRYYAGLNRFVLIAIPMFILCGDILYARKISKTLVNFAQSIFGRIRGSLSIVTTFSCMLFGAISGSGPATASAIGSVVAPEMEKEGYDKTFTAAVIASSGPLGILIPPSILLIVYGAVTDTSIGKLFLGGVGAGICFGVSLMIYQYIVSKKENYGMVSSEKFSLKRFFKSTKDAAWALGAPIIILGGIYGGFFTPTEAGVIAVVYSFLVAKFVFKNLTAKDIKDTLLKSGITMATIMFIIACVSVFNFVLVRESIPQNLTNLALKYIHSPLAFLFISNIIILIAGMFENGSAVILLLAPIFCPMAIQYGIDPVFFGVLMTANLAIGMTTPPVAVTLYVAARICDVKFDAIVKKIWGFILVMIIALILLTLFPGIIMFLPNLSNL
ncbi:C4-dicarboxylate TRAP transporter large permease protein DctM [subsurface metagenome]